MTLQLHTTIALVITTLAAWLMTQAGLAKRALELKRPPRICPSCGRMSSGCRCSEGPTTDK